MTPEQHIRALLLALGEDPNREGLRDTPRRMLAMLQELCERKPFKFTVFDAEGMDSMVIQSNIPFTSTCEHHLALFTGEAHIAYIPDRKIVGLSKLARAVQYCAKGLNTQERITLGVAAIIEKNLKPLGVGVVMRATHSCMSARGVKVADTWTTTSCMRGALMDNPSARAEFLALIT